MGIRFIALDLDGTLLNSAKEITEYTINTLRKAADQGIFIVLATGRSLSGIPDNLTGLSFIQYALTLNGAYIVNVKTREIIYQSGFKEEEGLQLWQLVQQFEAIPDCAVNGEIYMERKSFRQLSDYNLGDRRIALIKQTRKETENIRQILLQKVSAVYKINLLFKDPVKRKEAIHVLKQLPFVEVSSSLDMNLELNRKGSNKGSGLEALAKFLGLKKEEIMACGDADNDISMIEEAGLGIAMGNAVKKLRDKADAITLSNDEDGVAYAVDHWVLNEGYQAVQP